MAKTKKELGLDSMGVQKSMRLTDYLGDTAEYYELSGWTVDLLLYREGWTGSRNGCNDASDRKDF